MVGLGYYLVKGIALFYYKHAESAETADKNRLQIHSISCERFRVFCCFFVAK